MMPATPPKAGVSGPEEKWAERKKDPATTVTDRHAAISQNTEATMDQGLTATAGLRQGPIPIIRVPIMRRVRRAVMATGRHRAATRADRPAGHTTSRGTHMALPGHMTVRETGILTAAAGRPSTSPGRKAPTTASAVLTDTVVPSRDAAASSASHMARSLMEGGKTECSTTTTRPSTR